MRDLWSIQRAIDAGEAVVHCIKSVEKIITEKAPKNFPNRLSADFTPENETAKLEDAINAAEELIKKNLEGEEAEKWSKAVAASGAFLKAETEFLDEVTFLQPIRYLSISDAVRDELLKLRLAYLAMLVEQIPEEQEAYVGADTDNASA